MNCIKAGKHTGDSCFGCKIKVEDCEIRDKVYMNRWIPITEQLPERQLRVLVKTDKSPLVVGWLMFDEWYTDFGSGYGKLNVTHWRYLPER